VVLNFSRNVYLQKNKKTREGERFICSRIKKMSR
jgi:hypothetical protein